MTLSQVKKPYQGILGREQRPRSNHAAKLSWLVFQLEAAAGNIKYAVGEVRNHPMNEELLPKSQKELQQLLDDANKLGELIGVLGVRVKGFNKNKKWRRYESS